jgi:hypothetical protein
MVEPRPRQAGGADIGQEDVGVPDQRLDGLAAGWRADVQHDRALAPVVQFEDRVGGLIRADGVEEAAHRIAVGRLDLDHVGAPVGHDPSRAGGGDIGGQLDDPQIAQHPVLPLSSRGECGRFKRLLGSV